MKQSHPTPQPVASTDLLATLTSPRPLLILAALLALPTAVVIVTYLGGLNGVVKADGEVATGDFVVFYTGGRMILEGHGPDLFDAAMQRQIQDTVTGPGYTYHHWYVNPPLFAIALAPLAALPFVQAFYAYDAMMVAALVLALWLLKPHLPTLARDRQRWWATVLLVLTFHPIARTLFGGQNTPLTLLLLAGTYANLRGGRPVWAGVCLGLLSYKPQYLIILGLVLMARRCWRPLAASAVVALAHYGLGAVICGADWPVRMLHFLSIYRVSESATNFHLHIALLPVLSHALPAPWAAIAAALAITAVVAALLWMARGQEGDWPDPALLWAAAIAATLLVSPHTQYYDTGLLALAVLLALDFVLRHGSPSRRLRLALIAGFLCYPAYPLVSVLGFQPLVLWPLLTLGWVLSLAGGSRHLHTDCPAAATAAPTLMEP